MYVYICIYIYIYIYIYFYIHIYIGKSPSRWFDQSPPVRGPFSLESSPWLSEILGKRLNIKGFEACQNARLEDEYSPIIYIYIYIWWAKSHVSMMLHWSIYLQYLHDFIYIYIYRYVYHILSNISRVPTFQYLLLGCRSYEGPCVRSLPISQHCCVQSLIWCLVGTGEWGL